MSVLHRAVCAAVTWKLQSFYIFVLLVLIWSSQHVLSCPPLCICSVPALERLSCAGIRAPGFNFTSFTTHGFPSWVKSVSLSNSHIKYFQANEMWTRIEILDLSVNNISDFYPAMFRGLANLTFLNLNRNNISALRYHDETIIPNLTTLDLSYNNISVLNNESFHGLPVLQTISLQGNMIKMLMSNVFNNIPALRSLDLSDNYILYIHPNTFEMSPILTSLDLSYNELRSLPDKVVSLFRGMTEVSLAVNDWDCSCVVHDLLTSLHNDSHVFLSGEYLTCQSPVTLHGTRLKDLQISEAKCIKPAMLRKVTETAAEIERVSVTLMKDLMLDCPVSGVPPPAIVWETPRGRWFAQHQSYHLLYEHHIDKVQQERSYEDRRMSYISKVSVLTNGSLYVEYVRGLFIGNFSCFAINPHGNISKVIAVNVHAPIEDVYILSLFIYAGCTAGFLVIGFIVGGIEMLFDKCCKSEKVKTLDQSIEVVEEVHVEDNDVVVDESCKDQSLSSSNYSGSPPDNRSSPYMVTPYESPMKCNTPTDDDEFRESPEFTNHIMETMEEVRWRLRHGVERKLERVRSGVQNIRDTGTLYYQNIKTSSTLYMQTIKESSSVAASRVRTGMVMGMEQVKYHVQSIKEFCGTGDMGAQTISTVSFETNVDTQRQTDIIRSHTYV